jgi:predicted protein tyrosine phosphatase
MRAKDVDGRDEPDHDGMRNDAMKTLAISTLTICGIEELPGNSAREVTHVLSVLDPDRAEIEAFGAYGTHERVTLRFHDIIDPAPDRIMPAPGHVAEILGFGEGLRASAVGRKAGHLLVHCHMGISRSTAAMLTLMAQADPHEGEDALFARLREIRPQAWPNSVMIGFADEQLGRHGRLTEALGRHYAHQIAAQPKFRTWMNDLGRKRELEMAV